MAGRGGRRQEVWQVEEGGGVAGRGGKRRGRSCGSEYSRQNGEWSD